MPLKRRLGEGDLNRAVGMLESGRTQVDVAGFFRVTQSVISRAWTRYQTTGSVTRRHGGGRQRCTTHAQDRCLVISASRNRHSNARKLQETFQRATGVLISDQTVRNRLHDAGFRARRPVICTPLSGNHRRARVHWCEEHLSWEEADWDPVLFTDESKFCLDFTDGRRRVWRRKNERYCDAAIVEHDRYGGGSVMVWGGISLQGRTDLHVIQRGTLNGMRYRDDILHPLVRPYAGAVGSDFLLMDDNAPPHRARIVTEYLEQECIERMEWPARSPDLNPIEHVWDMLQVALSNQETAPQTLQELGNSLVQQWQRIPQDRLSHLIRSIPRRCQAVLDARGGHTRY